MSKAKFDPRDHGLNMTLPEFRTIVTSMFSHSTGFTQCETVDELLLNPEQAIAFCNAVRRNLPAASLKDHEILRALINHRKNKQARA